MAPTALLSKTSVRTAGVLTLSGLMVGGVVLSQGADAAPETQAVSNVTPVAALHSVDAQIDYVPSGLARPAVAPKSHQQLAAEKKAADDAAQAKAAAQQQAEQAQKKQQDQARKQQEAQAAQAAAAQKEKEASAATAEESAPQQAVTQTASTQDSAPQASSQKAQASSGSTAGSGAASSEDTQPSETEKTEPSGNYDRAAVVQAARHQIGVQQDCTALVTNSLRAAGINFHGWPQDYLSLGHTVSASQAQPGDIIYYASNGFGGSHVAIYLGNGRAIHGGWEGGSTAEFSANLPAASSPVFIHVDR